MEYHTLAYLANKLLKVRLVRYSYYECRFMSGICRHLLTQVSFSLVLESFGGKYKGKIHAEHLLKTLKKYYKCQYIEKKKMYVGVKVV